MVYQPKSVYPSASAIDIYNYWQTTFSMEIVTNTSVVAYQLFFYDMNNELIYYGDIEELSTPLYNGDTLEIPLSGPSLGLENGQNYKWRARLFQDQADMLIARGKILGEGESQLFQLQINANIKEGMFLRVGNEFSRIVIYDPMWGIAYVQNPFTQTIEEGMSYTIYSDFIETVPDYVFYARSTPQLYIENFEDLVTSKSFTFRGNYSQDENVPIKYYRYSLVPAKYSPGYVSYLGPEISSGDIYSSNIIYTFDGLQNGQSYEISLYIENELGQKEYVIEYFDVSYQLLPEPHKPSVEFVKRLNGVSIEWGAVIETEGVAKSILTEEVVTPNYLPNTPYSPVVSLYTNGYKVEWEKEDGLFEIPETQDVSFQFSLDENFFFDENGEFSETRTLIKGDAFNDEESFEIRIDGIWLEYLIGGEVVSSAYFYDDTEEAFVLTTSGVPDEQSAYYWDDDYYWEDDFYWTEGGTILERICNHWWKVRIVNDEITIREIIPD